MSPEILHGRADAPWVLTCEHASQALPPHVGWPPEDLRLVASSARALEAPAVLATVSRLWIDLNRAKEHPTLIRDTCDGLPVRLNRGLDPDAIAARIADVYDPFYAAVDRVVAGTDHADVLSMHSFTPIYEGGPPRWMELGVLFDREAAMAEALAAHLADAGFAVAINEPWSGQGGLMHSCQTAADAHGRRALEIEVRQDLAVDPTHQRRIVAALADGLRRVTAR